MSNLVWTKNTKPDRPGIWMKNDGSVRRVIELDSQPLGTWCFLMDLPTIADPPKYRTPTNFAIASCTRGRCENCLPSCQRTLHTDSLRVRTVVMLVHRSSSPASSTPTPSRNESRGSGGLTSTAASRPAPGLIRAVAMQIKRPA
jgi:hypothetical protein